ncbi:ABC transporter permease [soil metagenome]
MMTDFHFALRQLRKTPGFTLLAVLTLALGIGLNTSIFSLINDLFLRALPFAEAERVVHVYATPPQNRGAEWPLGAPRFMQMREGQTIFSGIAAENFGNATLTDLGDPVQMPIFRVTSNYFDVLGVRPTRGRAFLPEEEERADVAIVTEAFWRTRTGSDPNIIGRTITLDGTAHTVVGVIPKMPVLWSGPNAEVWTTKPFVIPGFSHERMMRGTGFLRVVGRLKEGISYDQARAALGPMEQSYRTAFPEKIDAEFATFFRPLPEDVGGDLRPLFFIMLGAVGFVLLIACSNVANLLLVRFSGRRREIALRLAIGASRTSVLRLFVLESLLVSALAGIHGVLLAWVLVPLIPKLAANILPLEANASATLSLPVLGFTLGLSLLTGLIMGLYPAWQSSHADLVDGLKEGSRGSSGSIRQQRFRKVLVGAQVALSVTLLAGAALLIVSFIRLSQQEPGFNYANVWVGAITLPQAQYGDMGARTRFAEQTLTALRAVPGLESVAASSNAPLLVGGGATLYARGDREMPPVAQRRGAPSHDITPGWFRTWGIPLLAGRDFNEHDIADRPNVAIISQTGAKTVFGDENPIGKTLVVTSGSVPVEIVGVVADIRSVQLAQRNEMEFYRPLAQENFPFLVLTVRSPMPPEAVTKQVQAALRTIDPGLALVQPQAMEAVVTQALGQARLMMTLLGVFAVVALLLATVGIYGAVAYTVEQRTGEIGVRMALGAQTADVLRLVLKQGMTPVLFGLVVGIAAALALGRLLTAQLHEVSPHNPLLLAATAATLGLAALLACLFPACKATLLNPVQALRAD